PPATLISEGLRPSPRLRRQYVYCAGGAQADHVRQADLGALDLTLGRGATEVGGHLEDARNAGRAERMALRQEPAGDVHRDAAAVRGFAFVDQAPGLAFLAETEVLVVEQLGRREAVV